MINIIMDTIMSLPFIGGIIIGSFLSYYKVPITPLNVVYILGMLILFYVVVPLLVWNKWFYEIKDIRNFIEHIGGKVK